MDRTISWMIAGGDRDLTREARLQRLHRQAIAAAAKERDRAEAPGGRLPRLALAERFAWLRRDRSRGPALECCAA